MTATQLESQRTHQEFADTAQLLNAVERLRPIIETNARRAEAERRLPQASFDAMLDAGLFGMLAPRAYGGLEVPPSEAMRVWEAVAHIDSAAAWNLVMNQGLGAFAAWLPEDGAKELFGDGPTTVAGAFFPPGTAQHVDGAWRITARVPFASGCHNARWFWFPAVETKQGEPVVDADSGEPIAYGFFVPREEAEILDTWHTLGMRGTGSADIGVTDVTVPDRRALRIGPLQSPAPGFEGALYRLFPLTAVLGEATVSVGVAAASLEAAVDLVKAKTPAFSTTVLRDQAVAQHALGRAAANVQASRDTLYAAARDAYDEVTTTGDLLSWDAKLRVQLAVTFAAEACATAVRIVHEVAGASAIRQEQPFERLLRDCYTLTQHASKNSARNITAGRLLLGLENDWTALNF